MINMIIYFKPDHELRKAVIPALDYYPVPYWRELEKFICPEIPTYAPLIGRYAHETRNPEMFLNLTEGIRAHKNYQRGINSLVELATQYFEDVEWENGAWNDYNKLEPADLVVFKYLLDKKVDNMIDKIYEYKNSHEDY